MQWTLFPTEAQLSSGPPAKQRSEKSSLNFFFISLNIEWIYDLIRFVSNIFSGYFTITFPSLLVSVSASVSISLRLFHFLSLRYDNLHLESLWRWTSDTTREARLKFTVCLSEQKWIFHCDFFLPLNPHPHPRTTPSALHPLCYRRGVEIIIYLLSKKRHMPSQKKAFAPAVRASFARVRVFCLHSRRDFKSSRSFSRWMAMGSGQICLC